MNALKLGIVSCLYLGCSPFATGTVIVALTMMLVILPAAAAWGVGGDALSHLMADEGTRRNVALALGLAIAATVVLVWI